MLSLGMDIGTSTVKLVLLKNQEIEKQWMAVHHGNPFVCLKKGLSTLELAMDTPFSLCVTGSNTEALLEQDSAIPSLGDIPAIVEGVRWIIPQVGSVIEIGSQGARFITEVQSRTPQFAANEHLQAVPVPFLRIRCPVWAASWRIILRWLSRRRASRGFPDAAQCLPKRISFTASRKAFPHRTFCWDCAMQ